MIDYGSEFRHTLYGAWKVIALALINIGYLIYSGFISGTTASMNIKLTMTKSIFLSTALVGMICFQINCDVNVAFKGAG